MVVMVVMAVLVAPPSTMANVVKDSLATILWLTQNLKATSLEVPPPREDLFLGRYEFVVSFCCSLNPYEQII